MAVTHRELAEVSEQGLVESHHNGDGEAFDNIVRRYQPGLLAHARRRLGSQQAAEDAVQETLLRAYRALPRFNGEYRLGSWLHRILRNVCTDEANRRRRHLALVDRISASEPACAHEAVPADQVVIGHDRSAVVRALDELPESYRTALVLRAVEELPYDEVAMVCGISEENARARVSRARNVLRRTTARFGAYISVLGVTLRRGNRGSGAAAVNAATSATSAGPSVASPMVNPAVVQLTTAAHDLAPAASAAGRAIAVLASAAAVIVPAALSSSGSDHHDGAAAQRPRSEVSVEASAPEVLGTEHTTATAPTTVPATSASVSVTAATVAPPRTARVAFHHLTVVPDGDAWTVSGDVVFETDAGLLFGVLEPYSHFSLGPDNGWGARTFDLTGFVTLTDGRAVTVRMNGTAAGDPPVQEPTTTTSTTAAPTTTFPIATTTTVVGDRPDGDGLAALAPTTTLPDAPTGTAPASPSPTNAPTNARYELTGIVGIQTGEVSGLFSRGRLAGVLELDGGAGVLQVDVTERHPR